MKKEMALGIIPILLSAIILTTASVRAPGVYWYDSVFIEPEVTQVYVGDSVVVDVGFEYGFDPPHPSVIEFSLSWDDSLLDLDGWESLWDSPTVVVGDNYLSVSVDSPFENWPLMVVGFRTKAVGSTILDLFDSNVYTVDGYAASLPLPPSPIAVHNIETGLNYTRIQEAINAPETQDGHTIAVDSGIYFEHIVVNKSVSLVGEDKYITIIDGIRSGTVVYVSASNVTLTGFTVQNGGHMGSDSGIYLYKSSFDNLSNNIVRYNYYGITLAWSTNNSITGNIISRNEDGIRFCLNSVNNTVSGNTAIDNLVNGIWIESTASANIIKDNNVSQNGYGIELEASSNSVVRNNCSLNKGDGIMIFLCSNNFLADNVVSNGNFGIIVQGGSNNILYRNTVSNNVEGILVYDSDRNNITSNIVSNNEYGIELNYFSQNNRVVNNKVSKNGDGITLIKACNNNTLIGNNVFSNTVSGIRFNYASINNMIFHNNFINNTQQVVSDGYLNTWDNGYPSGGNHWSSYTDLDEYSGPNQDQLGSDYIWDHPYVISSNNRDHYPFVNKWSVADVNHDGVIDVIDAAAISAHWYPGPPIGPLGFDTNFDINSDGAIDVLDAAIVSAYWTGPPKGPLAHDCFPTSHLV